MDNQAYRRPLRMVNDCESPEKNGTNEKKFTNIPTISMLLGPLGSRLGPEPPVG